jgi:glutathione synthase
MFLDSEWGYRHDDMQPLQLGVFRSDYLLHEEESGLGFKQVEFNTISVSFGGLSKVVDGLHRHVPSHSKRRYSHTIIDT